MAIDSKLVFCEAQAIGVITNNAALAINNAVTNLLVATNVIDLGDTNTATRDGGDKTEGNPLMLKIECSVTQAGAGGLFYFQLMSCDTEGGTYTMDLISPLFASGALVAGKAPVWTTAIPGGTNGVKRFLKLYFGALTANTSAGTFSAYIQPYTV